MERFFAPVGTSLPAHRRVLVLAPHADDEVFGCGGLLSLLQEHGADITIIVISLPSDQREAETRRRESRCAAEHLGYPPPDSWALPDGTLAARAEALLASVTGAVDDLEPELVLAPSPWEMHRDHRTVCEAALSACQLANIDLAFYEVGQPLTPNLLVDITAVADRKTSAMGCFASQLAHQDYRRHITALNVYRTYSLPRDTLAAEAFLMIPAGRLQAFRQAIEPERLTAVAWQAEEESRRFDQENHKLAADIQSLTRSLETLEEEKRGADAFAQRLQHDIEALNAVHATTLEHLAQAQQHADALSAEVQFMRHSRSWRLTRPLRRATHCLRSPRTALHRLSGRLPGWLRAPAHGLYRRLMQRAESLWTSSNQQSANQAMIERRQSLVEQPQALPLPAWASAPLPLISVSVVTYSSERWLEALLESLERQAYPLDRLELIFTDNGSRDTTLEILDAFKARAGHHFYRVTLHRLDNPGFGAAHNHAAREARGDYLLITNPDLEFEPDTLHRVVGVAQRDSEEVASWELRQAPFEHPKCYDPVTLETLWSSHACILIRRSIFERLGGYDERIFLYGEDVEFSFRCREAGYLLRYCPTALVQHHTYEAANQVKPAQYLGSTRANLFLRLRYGRRRDMAAGALMALAGLLRGPFPGARRRLLGEYLALLRHVPALLRENRSQSARGIGIFRGFDYAMARHGAFVPVQGPPAPEQAPLISIITRTYQGRDWLLRQAGFSVMQQTWPCLEWIVVEDGGETCRDTTRALAEQTCLPVRYASQPKLGRSAAGNLGLRLARGRWCVFLDDDDLLYADHLETLATALLKDAGLAAAYSLAWDVSCHIDHAAKRITESTYVQHGAHIQEFDTAELAWRNYIPIQAILFDRRLFEERGGFNETLDQLEDWNLWRRYAHGERFKLVPKTTSLFRTPAAKAQSKARQELLDEAYRQVKEETDNELKALEEHSTHG